MAEEDGAKAETKEAEQPAETKPEAKPETKPDAGAKPETEPAKPETKPAPKPAPKPAGTKAVQPAEKPAAAPPAKPATETAPAAKPEAKPAKPGTKPEAGPAGAKPETEPAKPETAPAAKPEAKPAPKPETKPAPAEPELPAFEKKLSEQLVGRFGERAQVRFVKPDRVGILVAREDVREVASYLRDEMNFDHAESVAGVDYPADKEIEVVYHLGSYTDESLSRQVLELATRAPREEEPRPGSDSTVLPSLREVFYSVEFHERECFEMLGVYFEDHPDNRRLLLPEDWADIPPLRKDFAIKGR